MNTEMTETMTVCDFVGIPESVSELKNRWLNLNTDRLRTAALLSGCPSDWIPTILEHFRNFNLSEVEGDDFDTWSCNAESLFLDLIQQTALELSGTELNDWEKFELQDALNEIRERESV